jgi:hypothetical protein
MACQPACVHTHALCLVCKCALHAFTILLACAVVPCHALVAAAILLWLLRLTICNHLQLCETARVDVPHALCAHCVLIFALHGHLHHACTHLQGKTWQATPGGQLPTPPAVPVSNDSNFFRVVEDVNGVSWFRRDTQLGECALAPIKLRSRTPSMNDAIVYVCWCHCMRWSSPVKECMHRDRLLMTRA